MSSDPSARAPRVVSYRPGSWFGVFGDHATVLLPPTEKRRVAALWELVDDGAGFSEVLDALIAGGLRDLPAFVLVSDTDATTQVVLRGPATARFETPGETVDLDGAQATTWVERTLVDVVSMTVDLEQAAAFGTTDLTSAGGLARVGRVSVGETDSPGEAVDGPVSGESAYAEPSADWEMEWGDPPLSPPPGPPLGAAGAATRLGGGRPVDPDPWEGQETEAFAAVGPGSGPDLAGGLDELVDLDGQPADEPTEEPADDLGASPADDAGHGAGTASAPPADDPHERPAVVARLVFSHGETVDVDRSVLVGRAPEARRFSSGEQPRLVTVPSPHQEISATHLEVRPAVGAEGAEAVVTDLGSTNGTLLVRPGQTPADLRAHVAVPLVAGDVVDLGDGLSLTVEAV